MNECQFVYPIHQFLKKIGEKMAVFMRPAQYVGEGFHPLPVVILSGSEESRFNVGKRLGKGCAPSRLVFELVWE